MKHGRHPAQYDAWYQIKDYTLNFNNEKSNCVSLCDSIATSDMGCRHTTYTMTMCLIQFEPRLSWIQSSNVTHQQLCCFWLSLLTEVHTSHLAPVCLAVVWRSTGLSNSFLFLCACGSNTLDFTLKSEPLQHTILGNLIYKPLFPLHFMHIFKLCIKFHVLQILFVNNKSWLNICMVNFHPMRWLSLCTAVLNLRCKSACNNWIIYRDQLVLKEVRGGSDHCDILSFNHKNQSKPHTNLSKLYQTLWPRLKAVSRDPSH